MKLSRYASLDAVAIAELTNSGEIHPSEFLRAAHAACDEVNPDLNAVIELYDPETVQTCARGPLAGVPFLAKDLGAGEAGRRQEMGSRLARGRVCSVESHYYGRMKTAGVQVLGRATASEFGVSGSSSNLLHGTTANPWDVTRNAGGSTGGGAAAVAAGIVPMVQASDGGGSIRGPASFCGLVGLKPSRGRVSHGPGGRDPLLGLVQQLVLCRTLRDAATALDVLSGYHAGDPYGIQTPRQPFMNELSCRTEVMRIGVARSAWGEVSPDPEILDVIEDVTAALSKLGHRIEDIDPPYSPENYTDLLWGLAGLGAMETSLLAREMDRAIGPETLDPVNLKLYEAGLSQTARDTFNALEGAGAIRSDVARAFEGFDLWITPTMPMLPFGHGSKYCQTNETVSAREWFDLDCSMHQYLGVFNATGNPCISLPLGQSSGGLPIGIQLVAPFACEDRLLRMARDLEDCFPWSQRRPAVHVSPRPCQSI